MMSTGRFRGWLRKKLTRPDIERLLKETATEDRTLILNCEDGPFERYFPNHVRLHQRPVELKRNRAVAADPSSLPLRDDTFPMAVCTGWLEHIEEPAGFIGEVYRVLAPGGRAVFSASSAFSVHNAPNDYYHFTPFGIRRLFEGQGFTVLTARGSCGPFRTLAILLQRICYQTDLNRLLKACLFGLAKLLPVLDRVTGRNYGDYDRTIEVDSCLSSNVHLIAEKPPRVGCPATHSPTGPKTSGRIFLHGRGAPRPVGDPAGL